MKQLLKRSTNFLRSKVIGKPPCDYDRMAAAHAYLKHVYNHYLFPWPVNQLGFRGKERTVGNVSFERSVESVIAGDIFLEWRDGVTPERYGLQMCIDRMGDHEMTTAYWILKEKEVRSHFDNRPNLYWQVKDARNLVAAFEEMASKAHPSKEKGKFEDGEARSKR